MSHLRGGGEGRGGGLEMNKVMTQIVCLNTNRYHLRKEKEEKRGGKKQPRKGTNVKGGKS